MATTELQQVQLDLKGSTGAKQWEKLHSALLSKCPGNIWPNDSYQAACAMPILINTVHERQLSVLHEAITIALNDIVCRWWTDLDARFPHRMPLENEEEGLLKWMEDQVSLGNLRGFSSCMGSWRPDFMVEKRALGHQSGIFEENFIITEINARFSFNGFMHGAYGHQGLDSVLKDTWAGARGLTGATDPSRLLDGLFSLFQADLPLHLLKGEESGMDIHMFIYEYRKRFGTQPKLISPSDLRLLPDRTCQLGYRLCCVSKIGGNLTAPFEPPRLFTHEGETLEQVHQVGLELHQHELAALTPEMRRHLSLRCFNDMRSILLVHDKRMLGVVRQEIPNMVSRGVLNPAQATALYNGIVDTILPNSPEIESLLQASRRAPQLRHNFILKPIRSGKGNGILFGEDLRDCEWISKLENLQSNDVGNLRVSCVIQRRIVPHLYNMMLKPDESKDQYPLVGTYHVTNGQLLGLGIWRSSRSRIIAVSCGGSWICSVTCLGEGN